MHSTWCLSHGCVSDDGFPCAAHAVVLVVSVKLFVVVAAVVVAVFAVVVDPLHNSDMLGMGSCKLRDRYHPISRYAAVFHFHPIP